MSSTTFGTWARRVGALEELPAPFRAAFEATGFGAARAFPLVIAAPEFRFDRFRSEPRVLAVDGDRIACLVQEAEGVRTTRMTAADVFAVEWGRDLLWGWLALEAHGAEGPAALRVEFNAASSDVFRPIVSELRRARYAGARADGAHELRKIAELAGQDLSLAQLAAQALVDGEEVVRCHVQPAAVEGPGGAAAYPAVLLLLSQRELLILRGGGGAEAWYGATWRHLDLARVQDAQVLSGEDRPGARLVLHTPGPSRTEVELPGAAPGPLRAFADAVLEVRARR